MAKDKKQLFEYAVLKRSDDGTVVVVEPATVLATDAKRAELVAMRAIPEEHVDEIDDLEITVRPFQMR